MFCRAALVLDVASVPSPELEVFSAATNPIGYQLKALTGFACLLCCETTASAMYVIGARKQVQHLCDLEQAADSSQGTVLGDTA